MSRPDTHGDPWLVPHLHRWQVARRLLEIGCGEGRDTKDLLAGGHHVIGVDLDSGRLDRAQKRGLTGHIVRADATHPLPFADARFDAVIASLSLHYFRWDHTCHALSEIRRVLAPNGELILRVNSTADTHYGASTPTLATDASCSPWSAEFRLHCGRAKRFFSRASVHDLLRDWRIEQLRHYEMMRYEAPKAVWEARATA